jgi:group I intron endonuclease
MLPELIIYRITNTINGKAYIGQTVSSLKERWRCHLKVRHSTKIDTKFARAIRKYGTDNWATEVLESVSSKELLNEREIYWIAHYNTFHGGYNSTTGGFSTVLSEEARKKISIAAKKRIHSLETKQKIGLKHKGNTYTKGRKQSAEQIEKRVSKIIGMKRSPEYCQKQTERQKEHSHLHQKHKCPYCPKEGNIAAMNRWHFDNCKFKCEVI